MMTGPFDAKAVIEMLKNEHNRSGSTHSSNSNNQISKQALAEKLRLDLSQIKEDPSVKQRRTREARKNVEVKDKNFVPQSLVWGDNGVMSSEDTAFLAAQISTQQFFQKRATTPVKRGDQSPMKPQQYCGQNYRLEQERKAKQELKRLKMARSPMAANHRSSAAYP